MGARKTVLVLTESAQIAQALQQALEADGHRVKPYRLANFALHILQEEFQSTQHALVLVICATTLTDEKATTLIRKLRISRQLGETRQVPVVFLTFDRIDHLIRSHPSNVLLLSPGVTTLQMPFRCERLCQLVSDATPMSQLDQLKDFLLPGNRLVEIEALDKHALSNLLGPVHLLRGACCSGEVTQGRAETLYAHLRTRLSDVEYYGEYLDLLDTFSPLPANLPSAPRVPSAPEATLADAVRSGALRILLIDDAHRKGWADVLKEILLPEATVSEKDGYLSYEEQGSQVRFDCIGARDDILVSLLGNKDPKPWRNFIDYDMVFLDLRLMEEESKANISITAISGYQLLKEEIRYRDPTIPVVMFTASERSEFIHALQALGIVGYFVKAKPRGDDEMCLENFLMFKNTVMDTVKRYYLRDFWYHTILLPQVIEERQFSQTIIDNLQKLLQAAYFKIQDAYPQSPTKRYDYNVAILIYHQCLELYAAARGVDPREERWIQTLSQRDDSDRERVALQLNTLRNQYVHPDLTRRETQRATTASVPVQEAGENEAIEAFLCLAYVVGGSRSFLTCHHNRGSKYWYKRFYDSGLIGPIARALLLQRLQI
jgi:CheY-like chemotaxis protein